MTVEEWWPPLPQEWQGDKRTRAKYRELVLAASVDMAKAAASSKPTPPKSLADDESEKDLHKNLAALISASIERSRDGAKFVQTAAAALGTIYTGILAFSFAAKDAPLPGRGLYAALFLGIAIVGASFYLAFIQQIKPIGRVAYRGSRPEDQWRRTEYLGAWTGAVIKSRAWALRTAVVALAFGVMFMPLAFLPGTLPSNPLAVTEVATTSQPAPPPSWPPPPTASADPAVLAVLYKAQLDDFAKHKDGGSEPAPSGTSTAWFSLVLFLGAMVILVLVATWEWLVMMGRRLRRPASA